MAGLAVGCLMRLDGMLAFGVLILVACQAGNLNLLLGMRLVALAALELHRRVGWPVDLFLGQVLVTIQAILARW